MKHSRLSKNQLHSRQTLFLIERDGKKNRLHRVIAALIRCRLRVRTDAAKQAVEMFLVFTAQRAAEFRPARGGFFDQLPESRYGAAHVKSPLRKKPCNKSCDRSRTNA